MVRSCPPFNLGRLRKPGLIILSAHYGLAAGFTPRGHRDDPSESIIDVTLPVQALVQDSRLYIPAGRGKASSDIVLGGRR